MSDDVHPVDIGTHRCSACGYKCQIISSILLSVDYHGTNFQRCMIIIITIIAAHIKQVKHLTEANCFEVHKKHIIFLNF